MSATTAERLSRTTASERPPRSWVLLLGALTAVPALAIDGYLPALPSMTRELATTPAMAQLTLTAVLAGLAAGQLVAGALSDTYGRRRPALLGLTLFIVSAVLCAAAPNAWTLVGARFLQGLAGGTVVVMARAIVRDRYTGAAAARVFASLMLVMGVAPIAAPVLGAQLLRVGSWRLVFVALAVVGAALLAVGVRRVPETLPVERRNSGGLAPTLTAFAVLLRDRHFVGYALAISLSFAAMFAYIAGSPFVLQDIHGLSAQAYSVVFASIAAGLITASQVGARVVGRFGPRPVLLTGLSTSSVGSLVALAAVLLDLPLPVLLAGLFVAVASVGLVGPNATALALTDHGAHAGSGSALLGVLPFALGAAAAPLVGVAGPDDARPMAVLLAALALGALTATLALTRRRPARVLGADEGAGATASAEVA